MRLRPDVEFATVLDEQLQAVDHADALKPTMYSWSKTVRDAIGLPMADLAVRLGISQPAVTKAEQNEASGTITIQKLEAIAAALDCEFVYGFVPKRSFAAMAQANDDRQNAARKAKRKVPRLA